MGIYWFGKSSLLLLTNIYFWLLIFSFKDLLSWNILNALFLFQHFFSKRHDWTLSWTWCIFCRLSINVLLYDFKFIWNTEDNIINADIFENIFIIIFFYHIKEESFHWANLTRSCLMKAQSWKYHLNYYRICIFAFFIDLLLWNTLNFFHLEIKKNLTFPSY